MTKLKETISSTSLQNSLESDKSSEDSTTMEIDLASRMALRGASANIAPDIRKSGKSENRLSIAEIAYARGLKALSEQNYTEAARQLSGFLELTKVGLESDSEKPSPQQARTLQGTRVVVEALQLLLAISEEIAILEPQGR